MIDTIKAHPNWRKFLSYPANVDALSACKTIFEQQAAGAPLPTREVAEFIFQISMLLAQEFGESFVPVQAWADNPRDSDAITDMHKLIRRLSLHVKVSEAAKSLNQGGEGSGAGPLPPDDDSHLSPAKIAELFHVPLRALQGRLSRWRESNSGGWIENADAGPRDAKYLYRLGSIRHIIKAMKSV